MTLESARIALKYMTPVMLLTDGYIGQASEPWRIPEIDMCQRSLLSLHKMG